MRWTLGFVCLSVACFGEAPAASSSSSDAATESSSTTQGTSTTMDPTDATGTGESGTTPTSTTPVDTSGAEASTDTGDACGTGAAPNPPPPPPGWTGPVFLHGPASGPVACPDGAGPIAVGHVGLPGNVDTCACACEESFEELCGPYYSTAPGACPTTEINFPIVESCAALPSEAEAFRGDAAGDSCMPKPVPPQADLVQVCAAEAVEGPCIDVPPEMIGPCIFREGMEPCPDPLVRFDAGRAATCAGCSECTVSTHCATAQFQLFAGDDCGGGAIFTFSDENCHQVGGAGSIRAVATVDLDCGQSSLTLTELTVCCPPM